jgi:hypothetical protein
MSANAAGPVIVPCRAVPASDTTCYGLRPTAQN